MVSALRHFFRGLRRRPGFAAAVIGVLGTGIAAGTVVFAVVDALVLDPYPFPDADRLLVVGSAFPSLDLPLGFFERLSGPELVDVAERSRGLEHPLPFDLDNVRIHGPDYPLRLFTGFFWADPFPTLGVEPHLGRGFTAGELDAGAPVAVVSHDLWRNQLGGDPGVVGTELTVDGVPRTVVGVMPPGADLFGTELWLPAVERAASLPRERRQFNLLARIASGADLEAVNAELAALAGALEVEHPERDEYRGWRLAATPWNRFSSFSYRQEALLSLGAVVFVILLVGANLANLMIARAAGRRGETALRLALGAGRRRIVGRALAESLLFALCGAAAGVLLAHWGVAAVAAWLPASMQPAGRPIALDAGVIGFALLLTVACALLFGLAPAFQLARTGVREALAGTAGRVSAGRRTRSLKRLLVVVQVAVAVVLLAGSFLLVRNLAGLLRADLGFDPESLLSMRLTLPSSEYQGEAVPVFFDALVAEVSALPGVGAASVAIQVAPFTRFGGELELRGREERGEGSRPRVLHTSVGDGYFEAMGLELLRGRPLDDRDRPGTPPAVVINQPAAERFFPGEDPLGKVARIRANRFDSGWAEVVGVVGAIRNVGPGAPPEPEVFTHHRQAGGRWNQMFLVVRADGDPRSLLPAIRRTVQRLDPEQPVYAVATGAEALAGQTAPRRVAAGVLTGFALAALALAALGIYGTVAQGVAERTREMGLRMALGAAERDVVALVVRESLATVGAGVLLGVLGALALARALASSFELVAGLDFQLLAAAAAALATAALLASTLPARRAGRLDPATSLREP